MRRLVGTRTPSAAAAAAAAQATNERTEEPMEETPEAMLRLAKNIRSRDALVSVGLSRCARTIRREKRQDVIADLCAVASKTYQDGRPTGQGYLQLARMYDVCGAKVPSLELNRQTSPAPARLFICVFTPPSSCLHAQRCISHPTHVSISSIQGWHICPTPGCL